MNLSSLGPEFSRNLVAQRHALALLEELAPLTPPDPLISLDQYESSKPRNPDTPPDFLQASPDDTPDHALDSIPPTLSADFSADISTARVRIQGEIPHQSQNQSSSTNAPPNFQTPSLPLLCSEEAVWTSRFPTIPCRGPSLSPSQGLEQEGIGHHHHPAPFGFGEGPGAHF